MQVDYLIVGQGIAGSLLSWFLYKAGKDIRVIDNNDPASASRVAAGIVNPITGKRSVKSWRIDELLPFAETTYRVLEIELGTSLYRKKGMDNYFSNEEDLNFYREKIEKEELTPYIEPLIEPASPVVRSSIGGYRIPQAFHLDLPGFCRSFNLWLSEKQLLREENFQFNDLSFRQGKAIYKDIESEMVIFCEGVRSRENPYFNWLPFNPVKGEILLVKIDGLAQQRILKKGVFILPVEDNVFKVGSTYDWQFTDGKPTEEGKRNLCERLEKVIDLPYKVLNQQAAIRPSVKDRRPLLGHHPKHAQLGIFNGLGTKGASLAPFFASHFVDHLENNAALDREVDVKRFIANFQAV